jgi:hypothetical protein
VFSKAQAIRKADGVEENKLWSNEGKRKTLAYQ